MAQYLSLEHPSAPTNYDEPLSLAGKLNATVTVTDGDGDVATDNVAIGAAISFEDDGPVADIVLVDAAALTLDELIGQRPANSAGDADANDSADDNVAANPFLAGYGIPIGLLANVALVSTAGSSVGADNEGATTRGDAVDRRRQRHGFRPLRRPPARRFSCTMRAASSSAASAPKSAPAPIRPTRPGRSPSPSRSTMPARRRWRSTCRSSIRARRTITTSRSTSPASSTRSSPSPTATATSPPTASPSARRSASRTTVRLPTSRLLEAAATVDETVPSGDEGSDPFSFGTPLGVALNVALVSTAGSAAGQDNEGASTLVTLSIVGGNGTDSALETTSGTQIFLYNEGGVIVGRVGTEVGAGTDTANPAGAVAFAISINNAGQATVAQYLSLEHPSAPNNYDEPINLAGKLDAVVTVTDGDGDVATDSVAIGAAISFEDDGPVANITALEAAATVDETVPSGDEGSDPFSFGTPLGVALNVALVSTAGSAAGQDNEGASTLVTLSIVGGNGTDSALETTSGTQIFLYNEGGVIVGRVGTEVGAGTDTANPAGAVAFAISINNAGQATVAQYLSLEHPSAPNNYDEPINLAGKLDAVVTVTDGDGDVATDSVAIGAAISFEDDGPVANIGWSKPPGRGAERGRPSTRRYRPATRGAIRSASARRSALRSTSPLSAPPAARRARTTRAPARW